MAYTKIKEDIYSVGVLNPNLRIFDIIMKTEYGTTYNSFLIRDEKTALIETAHLGFFEEYLEHINEVCDVNQIDYIILNHTEPDHSGSVGKLLDLNPDITVVGTAATVKYLENIANRDFKRIVVKEGDTLELGKRTLRFIPAPFLHWPDSMFTYSEYDKTVFTCDFLGAHYCEPNMIDSKIHYEDAYASAFEYYYQAIFGPFKKYVLAGLDKLEKLDFDTVCTSHGPVLTDKIKENMDKYRAWSQVVNHKNEIPRVLIVYVSAYGCTRTMAQTIQKTLLENKKCEVTLMNAIEHPLEAIKGQIDQADVLLLGSPTINRDALKPIWDVLSVVDAVSNQGKLCGIFGSYGWSGEAGKMLEDRVKGLKLRLFEEALRVLFVPSEKDQADVEAYAQRLAQAF